MKHTIDNGNIRLTVDDAQLAALYSMHISSHVPDVIDDIINQLIAAWQEIADGTGSESDRTLAVDLMDMQSVLLDIKRDYSILDRIDMERR